MKIDNINKRLEDKQIEKVRKIAASGDFLSAFFSVREFCNRMPACNLQLYDFQLELADAINNPHIVTEVANTIMEVYSKFPTIKSVRPYPFNCLALLKLRKVPQIKRFLQTYNLTDSFEQFRQKDKSETRKDDWKFYRENSPYDKMNISTMNHWNRLMQERKFEKVADSDINIFKKGKFYDDLRFRKASAMIETGQFERAIEYIKTSSGKEFLDKDLLIMIHAYIELDNQNAVQFYMTKAQKLANTYKIELDYLLPFLELYDFYGYWQELYDFTSGCMRHRPTENSLLLYKAVAAYNLGKKDEIDTILQQLAIINPLNCVPARIFENALALGKSEIKASNRLDEAIVQEIVESYRELLDICDEPQKIRQFVLSKRKLDNICTYIAFIGDKMTREDLCKIYLSHPKFDSLLRKMLYLDHVNISRKCVILYAIITCSTTRSLYFTNNYFAYSGPLYRLEEVNKYGPHLKSIYAKALIYLLSLPSQIEVFLPLFNFCVDLFIKQIISKNIDLLSNEEQVAIILINLYILLTFTEFPQELLITAQGIKKEDLTAFNYHAQNFGMKIVDRVLYINEQPTDIVQLFQDYQNGFIARLTKDSK